MTRLLLLTHDRADPSFRVRWQRFLPAFAAAGMAPEVREIPRRGRAAVFGAAAEAEVTVLHRRLLRGGDWRRLRRRARHLVYDFDDALCFRPRPPYRSRSRERRFFRTVAGADLVLAGNRYLADLARLRARRVHVAPTTVELYPPAPKRPEFTLVWIGQTATLPYLDAIWPALRAAEFRLRVIGSAAPAGAELVPWSLEEEGRALAECHAGLMPLPRDPFARGKCGFKLLQYYAAGLPAVASPVGVNRVLAEGGALTATAPETWVTACARLRDDPGLRARLGAKGRAYAARWYDPGRTFMRLLRLLRSVSAPPRAAGASAEKESAPGPR